MENLLGKAVKHLYPPRDEDPLPVAEHAVNDHLRGELGLGDGSQESKPGDEKQFEDGKAKRVLSMAFVK